MRSSLCFHKKKYFFFNFLGHNFLVGEKRKEVHAIATSAMLSCLCAISATLASYFVWGSLLALFLIPFFSSLAAYKMPNKFLPIYALASCSFCLLFSFHELSSALFTSFPGVLGGTLYGYLRKKECPIGYPILLGSYIYFAFTLLSVPLIEALIGRNMMEDGLWILGLNENQTARELTLLILYLFSLSSMLLASFFSEGIRVRIIEKSEKREAFLWGYPIFIALFSLLDFAFCYVLPSLCYVFLCSAFFLLICSYILYAKMMKLFHYLIDGFFFFIGIIIFALLYPLCPNDYIGGCLLGIPFLLFAIFKMFFLWRYQHQKT